MRTVRNRPPSARLALSALVAAVLALQPLTSAWAKSLPSSVTVLTRDDFARSNNFSLSDILDQAVGFDVEREGYRGTAARARLRGLSSPRSFVVAVDGRPLTHLFDGAADLSSIPLNTIERIEVTRGGAPLSYGPSAAGVVNVITTRPSYKRMLVDLGSAVGRDGVRQHEGRFFVRAWPGDLTYVAGLQNSGGFTFNDESQLTTHFGNFTRSFKKGGYWGLEYASVEGWSGTPNGSVLPIDRWDGYDERTVVDMTSVRNHNEQTARLLAASPKVAGGTFFGELTHASRDFDRKTAREGGIEFEDIESRSNQARLRFEREGWSIGGDASEDDRRLEGAEKRETTLAGGFAQARLSFGDLELSPGVRFDRHSEAGGGLSSRLSAALRASEGVVFSASAQRGSRFPNHDELFPLSGPAAPLDPEEVNDVDAGVAFEGTGYRVALTGFDTRIDDVIGFVPSAAAFVNAGEERSKGLEAEAAVKFGRGPWGETRVSGHFTARDTDRRDPGAGRFAQAPLSSKRLAFARVEYRLPYALTMINEFRYESEQYEGTGRAGRRLPPFGLWNLRFNAHIHTAVLFFAVENLTKRRYAEAFGSTAFGPDTGLAPQPERTFWAGGSIRFID